MVDAPQFGVPERIRRQNPPQAPDALLSLEPFVLRQRPVQVLLDLLCRGCDDALVVVEDLLVDALIGEPQIWTQNE